jgi:hypothetical protein
MGALQNSVSATIAYAVRTLVTRICSKLTIPSILVRSILILFLNLSMNNLLSSIPLRCIVHPVLIDAREGPQLRTKKETRFKYRLSVKG